MVQSKFIERTRKEEEKKRKRNKMKSKFEGQGKKLEEKRMVFYMLRFFNKRIHNRKGFTLIELIVVIAILAILALIAIPAYTAYKEKSAIAADAATCKVIYDAALMAKATLPSTALAAAIETEALTLLESGAYPAAQEKGATGFDIVFSTNDVSHVTNGGTARYPES